MKKPYDFAVIGGGSAGFNAARVAAGLGRRVAVIDGARKLGGLCILRGCMPSKTLIYSAEVLHLAKSAAGFGLSVPRASVNMRALHARKLKIIGEFADHRRTQLESGPFDLIPRYGAIRRSPRTVELGDGSQIAAKRFLIGTGSRVSVPPVPGLAAVPFWTSDDVLDLDFLSRSVILLGGGIVACELAQFLRRAGTRVCLIQRSPQILKGHSPAMARVVRSAFEDEGIEVLSGTKILGLTSGKRGVSVTFRIGSKTFRRSADHLVNALGAEPATAALSLDRAGSKDRGQRQDHRQPLAADEHPDDLCRRRLQRPA